MTPVYAVSLCVLLAVVAIVIGSTLLRRAFARRQLLPEELALAAAWVFVVGSFVWLAAFLSDSTLLGFGAPWTWLAASHFAAAGFGALTITALACRVVSDVRALRILRILLVGHPLAYLVTAAGISGFRFCDELGATSYQLIFVVQLVHSQSSVSGGERHATAMVKRERKDFHHDFTTHRFRVLAEHGEWDGRRNIIPTSNASQSRHRRAFLARAPADPRRRALSNVHRVPTPRKPAGLFEESASAWTLHVGSATISPWASPHSTSPHSHPRKNSNCSMTSG